MHINSGTIGSAGDVGKCKCPDFTFQFILTSKDSSSIRAHAFGKSINRGKDILRLDDQDSFSSSSVENSTARILTLNIKVNELTIRVIA